MSGLIFDDHDLGELFVYGDPEISILSSSVKRADSNSRNGSIVIGSTWADSTVSFTVAAIGTAEERRNAFSTLGMWFDVDEPKKLCLPDTPGRYYLAVPDGVIELNRHIGAETAKVTFALTDPIAYGREMTLTVPSGGSISFNVGGTYRARPRITASAVRDSSSQVWGLKLDNADFVHVVTGSASARSVDIDCDGRTCIVNSSTSMITLDSDWLELAPGTHTLVMDKGTGAATVKYRERWL